MSSSWVKGLECIYWLLADVKGLFLHHAQYSGFRTKPVQGHLDCTRLPGQNVNAFKVLCRLAD